MKFKLVFLFFIVIIPLFGQTSEVYKYNSTETTKNLEWYKNAKFGMFIHFGAYSLFEGKPAWWRVRKAQREKLNGEAREQWDKEFRETAKTFSPDNFDAKAIVKLAKETGMKWITIGAKHHEGFAIYPSEFGDFSSSESDFERDVLQELKAECDKEGIKLGFYYSHFQDWDYKGKSPFDYGFTLKHAMETEDHIAVFNDYCETKAFPQVKELMNRYKPFQIWYDTPGNIPQDKALAFRKIVKDIDKSTLICNRVGKLQGDYESFPDGSIAEIPLNLPWETCMISAGGWAYKPTSEDPNKGKGSLELIKNLCKIVSNGGVFLLNMGPRADGSIPNYYKVIWKEVGNWVQQNSEAIYGTQANPLAQLISSDIYCTTKRNKLYFFLPNQSEYKADGKYKINGEKINESKHQVKTWQRPNLIDLSSLNNKINKAYFLGSDKQVIINSQNGKRVVEIPKAKDAICDVLVIETYENINVFNDKLPHENENGEVTILPKDMFITVPEGKRKQFDEIEVSKEDSNYFVSSLNAASKTFTTFAIEEEGVYSVEITLKSPLIETKDILLRINDRFANIKSIKPSKNDDKIVITGFNLKKGLNSLTIASSIWQKSFTDYFLIKSIKLKQ